MGSPRRVAGALASGVLLVTTAHCTLLVDTSGLQTEPEQVGEAGAGADADAADAAVVPPADARTVPEAGVRWPTNGHIYELVVSPDPLSWPAARDRAAALGGHLATLTSAAENDFVYALVPGSLSLRAETGPWIGGYQDPIDAAPSEGWKWVTNEAWSFTAWAPSAPDDDNGTVPEYYLHFYYGTSTRASTWHDAPPVATTRAFVVEYE